MRTAQSDLVRVVLRTGQADTGDGDGVWAWLDVARSLPGRGAYLHPATDCLDLAERRRAFGRALRHPGGLDLDPLREQLTQYLSCTRATPE